MGNNQSRMIKIVGGRINGEKAYRDPKGRSIDTIVVETNCTRTKREQAIRKKDQEINPTKYYGLKLRSVLEALKLYSNSIAQKNGKSENFFVMECVEKNGFTTTLSEIEKLIDKVKNDIKIESQNGVHSTRDDEFNER